MSWLGGGPAAPTPYNDTRDSGVYMRVSRRSDGPFISTHNPAAPVYVFTLTDNLGGVSAYRLGPSRSCNRINITKYIHSLRQLLHNIITRY